MWEWILLLFSGYTQISISVDSRTEAMNWMFCTETPFFREQKSDKQVDFILLRRDVPGFLLAAEENGWEYQCGVLRGLPAVLYFCRKRPGIACGMAVLLIWCLLSQNWIWRVEITGNTSVSDEEIQTLLEEVGCGIGDWIPAIDYDSVHARFRALSDNIAWLSVYQNGTVAEVQVRESKKAPLQEKKEDGVFANVVAAEGGEIVITEVVHGEAVVHTGDVVLPGELLISGVVQMRNENQYRLTYAKGQVLARVACPISVEISKERQVKRYTGREKTDISLKIFKKEINLLKSTGISYTTCDTISTMDEVCLWGNYTIPVWIGKTVWREYVLETERMDTTLAAEEAMKELRNQVEIATADGEIISTSVTISESEDTYRIDCLLYCEKNIAKTVEFQTADALDETIR